MRVRSERFIIFLEMYALFSHYTCQVSQEKMKKHYV